MRCRRSGGRRRVSAGGAKVGFDWWLNEERRGTNGLGLVGVRGLHPLVA